MVGARFTMRTREPVARALVRRCTAQGFGTDFWSQA